MANTTFLPEPQNPDDLDPAATLDVLDERLVNPGAPPPDLIVTDASPPPLGRSWAYDFVAQQFVTSPAGGVADTHGLATLRVWIEKCLRTERGAHPIHSDDYGMVRPFDMIGMQLTDISKQDLEQRISDALTMHPSILSIDKFQMSYSTDGDDALYVSYIVTLADGQSISVSNLQLP